MALSLKSLVRSASLAFLLAFSSCLATQPAMAAKPGDQGSILGACLDAMTLESVVTMPAMEADFVMGEALKAGVCALFERPVPIILMKRIKTVQTNDGRTMDIWEAISPVAEAPIYVVADVEGKDA